MSETYNLIAVVKAKTAEAIRKFNDFTKGVKSAKAELSAFEQAGRIAAGVLLRDMVQGLTASFTESIRLGGQIETLTNSFEALTKAQGATDASLAELRKAVRGTVSDIDLLTSANIALSFKIPYEEFVRYAEAVTVVGRAVGIDATQSIRDFTVAMGRLSPRILDNLGIILPMNTAYEIYAERLGKTVEALTDSERALAYQIIGTERLIEKAEILAGTTSEAQIATERYAASIKNLKTRVGELLSPLGAITPILQGAMPLFGTFAAVLIPSLITKYGALTVATMAWGAVTGTWIVPAMLRLAVATGSVGAAVALTTGATVGMTGALKMLGASMGPVGWALLALAAASLILSEAWKKDWFDIRERTKVATDVIADYLDDIGEAYNSFAESAGATLEWLGHMWATATGTIEQHLAAHQEALALSYEEQVQIIKDNLGYALDEVELKYGEMLAAAETAHEKEIEEHAQFWIDQANAQAEGFDKAVEEYNKHFDSILSDTETHYGDLLSEAKDHASETISEIESSHADQLSETTAFYDDMLAEASAFLVAIREGRSRDLDDLELNYLLQKQALNEALSTQMLTTEEYEEALSSLEKAYRDSRSDIRDDYRIQELQAEDEFRTDEERINEERAAALEKIEQEKSDAITTIEEDLKAETERIEQSKADEVARINEERRTKIEEIRADEAALEEEHAYEMEQLERKKAVEIAGIQAQAELDIIVAQRKFHEDLEKAEKAHSREATGIWGDLWDSVRSIAGTITKKFSGVVTAAKKAYNSVLKWWKKATAKKASVPTGGGGGADVRAQRGFEGMVTKPTRFLVGEGGRPEYVSVTPMRPTSAAQGGRSIIINGPLVVIEGSADPKTARMSADMILQELRKIA